MKRKLRSAILTMFVMLCLTACGGQAQHTSAPPPAVETLSPAELAIAADLEAYSAKEETEADRILLDTSVSLTAESLADMEKAAAELDIDYPYGEISQLKTAYAAYRALPSLEEGLISGVLEDLDPQTLYERVKAANDGHESNWLEDGGHVYIPLDDEYLQWACEVICDTLDQELSGWNFEEQMFSIDYNIAHLKIFKNSAGYSNAAVSDDGIMTIQPVFTESMTTIVNNENAPSVTLAHETEHLLQKHANPRMEALGADRAFGFCYHLPELTVNSLFYTWMIEAAAEKLAARLYNCPPQTYLAKIGYLDSLTIPTLLAGADPQAVPRLTQQPSLDVVFDLFGCENESERMELLNCLYAIEVIQTEPEDFFAEFTRQTGREVTEDELVTVKRGLKAPACLTMSKLFYRALARRLTEQALSLREVFYLMSVWEFDLSSHLAYDDETRLATTGSFLTSYVELQRCFFEALSAGTGRPAAELQALFGAYLCRCEIPTKSLLYGNEAWTEGPEIPGVSAAGNAFLDEYYRTVSQSRTVPVYRAAEILLGEP